MLRLVPSLASFLVLSVALATPASAQRTLAYDTVSGSTPAAVSCGFCGGEKFGVVFRDLGAGRGLQSSEFPLRLDAIQVAVARATVTGDGFTMPLMCVGSTAGGTVSTEIEVYAGPTAPTGDILGHPATGPWPGETLVYGMSSDLMVSIETMAGSRQYNVMVNTVGVSPGIQVDPPNTYLRAVVTVPTGGSSSTCRLLSIDEPGAVGLRDNDGRIADETSFIYAINPLGGILGIPQGWHWNESMAIEDPITMAMGIGGDWLLRLEVTPSVGGMDAGMPMTDAGPPAEDAGAADAGATDGGGSPDAGGADAGAMNDAATPLDAGARLDAGMTGCATDSECAGGEQCVGGMCVRVSCMDSSECAASMTCVDGRCRNACSSDTECRGGEVCDVTGGHCVPSMDGGCGCRVGEADRRSASLLWLLALGLFLVRRRRTLPD